MGKRGPTAQYDFSQSEYIIEAKKLASFKTLLSAFNKNREPKIEYEYDFGSRNNKVICTKVIKQIA